ncbi:hypothetical protein LLH23_04450 [bacterium]|nr:hypothetical protein [bacterium]
MSRKVLLVAVVLLLVMALPAFAQQAGQGEQGGQRGFRPGMMGPMMMGGGQTPVMMIAEGSIYVIYMGQLSMYNAKTLELVKTIALPMPQMMGGPGGPPAAGGQGGPPPAPPG